MRHANLLQIEEPEQDARRGTLAGLPLLALGFRPFYLMAALFAACSVLLWVARYLGWLAAPQLDLGWHMHEMVYGFAVAVIVGFLLTAARNWTGLWTPRGKHLALLVAVWLAGRFAMHSLPWTWAAGIDLLFIPAAAWPLYRVMKKSGQRRNLPLLGLLGLLWFADLGFHLSRLAYWSISPALPLHAAILIIVVLEAVMGGRVIPGFTTNTVPGSNPVQRPSLDRAGLLLAAAAGLAWLADLPAVPGAVLACGAAASQAWRLWGWRPLKSRRHPLLWILHLSYAWISFGFLMLAGAELGLVPASTAFHALALGSMGGLTIGMMTRTALGHTGRLLKAGRRESAMYVLLQLGAVLRLCANVSHAGYRDSLLVLAGVSWSAAFLLYVFVYGPYLCRARLDGRPG